MGLIFGVIEGITPIIGWAIGSAGAAYVEQYDHWIAFVLLLGLGAHMVHAGFEEDEEDDDIAPKTGKKSLLTLMLTAFGTSIDAMTIGVSFAFLDVNILFAALLIGLATATMVTIGALLGNKISGMIGKRAEILGGLALILIGSWILYSHLSAI